MNNFACNLTSVHLNPNENLQKFSSSSNLTFEPQKSPTDIFKEEKPEQIEISLEKQEIYPFDHGNSQYYQTNSPVLTTDKLLSKSQQAANRFWAEIFSTINIGMTFITSFLLQLFKFLLFSLLRPLTVGTIQLTGDFFLKPVLSIIFNGLFQPFLIFFFNIATSVRDVAKPLAEALGYFLSEISNVCRAIRLVEMKN